MKFRITADVTDRQTGTQSQATGTVDNVDNKDEAWHTTFRTLSRNGYTVGDIHVDIDDAS